MSEKIDHVAELTATLQSINSLDNLCTEWHKVRPILVAAAAILKWIFPPGAAAIELIVTLLDQACPVMKQKAAFQ